MEAPESLYAALGRTPSGIYIVTLGGDAPTGMLASWVQQASFEPPMLTLAMRRGRYVGDRIEAGEPFAVNIVGDGQTQFLKHFGKGFEPDEPAFEGVATLSTPAGVPRLSEAIAVMECRFESALDAGDHRVVLAQVTDGFLQSDDAPMTHIRKRGDHY